MQTDAIVRDKPAAAAVTAPAPVRMSLAQALDEAQKLQRTEQLAAAETIYVEIIQQLPDEPNAHGFLGILRHQQGRTDEAVALLRRAIELVPEAAGNWINLGNVLIEAERFEEGAEALRHAIELEPNSATVYNNFGIACMRCGDLERSETAFLEAFKLEPDRADIHFNYARLLYVTGRYRESAAHSIRSLDNDPALGRSRKLLAMAFFALDEKDKAVEHLLAWKTLEPDNPEVDHHLAACSSDVPARASDDYVQHVFDDFASTFDQRLESLDYRAPGLVVDALKAVAELLPPDAVLLDAGCGTGLCGPLLKAFGTRLDGVDLSAGMLDRARTRACYDALHQAELTAYLQASPASYDAIVSADTLCYFGALEDFLRAAHGALRGAGVLLFSLEALLDGSQDYLLHIHGRYSHAKAYVLRVLAAHGFVVAAIEQAQLRRELNEPVQGWIVTAVRDTAIARSAEPTSPASGSTP